MMYLSIVLPIPYNECDNMETVLLLLLKKVAVVMMMTMMPSSQRGGISHIARHFNLLLY